jgi:hypothetical protein
MASIVAGPQQAGQALAVLCQWLRTPVERAMHVAQELADGRVDGSDEHAKIFPENPANSPLFLLTSESILI